MSRARPTTGRGSVILFALLVLLTLLYLGAYRVEWLAQGKPRTWCPENNSPLNRFGPGVALTVVPFWIIVTRAFKYRGGGAAMGLTFLLLGGVLLYLATMR